MTINFNDWTDAQLAVGLKYASATDAIAIASVQRDRAGTDDGSTERVNRLLRGGK